jgi:hypothetical protein
VWNRGEENDFSRSLPVERTKFQQYARKASTELSQLKTWFHLEQSGQGSESNFACQLAAALGLMLCPPVRVVYNVAGRSYTEHRLLWNGRGTIDWSRPALELCLVAVVGALAAAVAPTVGWPVTTELRAWFRRAGLVFGCAAVLILAATAGYDVIVRLALVRDYNRKVQEFQVKAPLLQEAFPLVAATHSVGTHVFWDDEKSSNPTYWIAVSPISNGHEAEIMLSSLGCNDDGIKNVMARFLSASTPMHDEKTLAFLVPISDRESGSCPPSDIFDRVATKTDEAVVLQ